MTRQDHLNWIVAEECLEIAQRMSKIARFGIGEVQPGQARNNRARMLLEFADLCGALEKALPGSDITEMVSALRPDIDAKKDKIEKFLTYSLECGTLAEVG